MPSRDALRSLATIKHNIALAREFLAGQTPAVFADNALREASRRLPEDMKQRHPNVPWANIAGAGNVYRHDYEDVASAFVWKTVRIELDGIAQAVEAALTERR